ncbi:hypothetical protein [Enterobacter bugandensis]|uniref:hypothetical protein n=1 Tax=Enterobacter bugandensis TaxID=881260 RepID=UPI00236088A1|nr:hypothetical protein [Enterobacter bugandensis]
MTELMRTFFVPSLLSPLAENLVQEDKKADSAGNRGHKHELTRQLKNINDEVDSFIKDLQGKNRDTNNAMPDDMLLEQGKRLKFKLSDALQKAQQTDLQAGEDLASAEEKALASLRSLIALLNQWEATQSVDVKNGASSLSGVVKEALIQQATSPSVVTTEPVPPPEKVPTAVISCLAQLQGIEQDLVVDLPILLTAKFAEMARYLSGSIDGLPAGSREKTVASLLVRALNEGLMLSDDIIATVHTLSQETVNTAERNKAVRLAAEQQIDETLKSNNRLIVVTSSIMTLIMVLLTLLNKNREASNKIWSASLNYLCKQFSVIRDTIIANGKSNADQQLSAAIAAVCGAVAMAGISAYQGGGKLYKDKLSHKAQDKVEVHQYLDQTIKKITNKIKLPKALKTPIVPASEPMTIPKAPPLTLDPNYDFTKITPKESFKIDERYKDVNVEIRERFEKAQDLKHKLSHDELTSTTVLRTLKAEHNRPFKFILKVTVPESENTSNRTLRSELSIKSGSIDRRLAEITSKAESTNNVVNGLIEELLSKQKTGHFKIPENITELIEKREILNVISSGMHNLGRSTTLRNRLHPSTGIDGAGALEDNLNPLTPYLDKMNTRLNDFHGLKTDFVKFHQENTTALKKALLEWNTPELNKFKEQQRLHAGSTQQHERKMQTANAMTAPFSQLLHATTFSSAQESVSEARVQEETAKNLKEILLKNNQVSEDQYKSLTENEKSWEALLQSINQKEISVLQKVSGNLRG